ncbi:MAG: enoyl-CoA hydratase [Limimaricola sp.]|uniref:enoyl-CoA hydratase-related protein n=1 Tax=Limimaricola sp. TaxID=2211665 RepID=UPI001D82C83F|nr:enoyl-CoA hydratase-related protein [Limimaricola sp.]MBI1417320.1 enoyl-CoA hydratase [Limimaricola sp.]
MAFQTLIVDIQDGVQLITLNRPEKLNALNAELLAELCEALEEADANDKVRCIVISGSDKAFAAGADISEMAGKSMVEMMTANLFARVTARITAIRKPIIAAVCGYALGGGCELAMMCDFIIASETAKFGQPEINLGVIAGMGGTQRLARFVGKAKAMDMNLTGRFMDAKEAEHCGLVSRIVPAKKVREEALAAAGKIAEKGRLAAQAAKQAVNSAFETPLAEGLAIERHLFHALFATDDQKEGMAAFIESREPQFRDR